MKKIFVMCPTYRNPEDKIQLGLFGIVSLIEQMEKQTFNGSIKISIVDSSSEPHPFFKNWNNNNSDKVLYFHIPNRDKVNKNILKEFPFASSFIPSKKDMGTKKWQKIFKQNVAWDNFIPWDRNYPVETTLKQQIEKLRPTIGMKRNFAIASLFEKFGEADFICYADDDDFRGDTYIQDVMNQIGDNDLVRMFNFYTYFMPNKQWGFYDIDLRKDINNNWLPSKDTLNMEMFNGLNPNKVAYKKYTVAQRFTPLLSLAFPHLSCEGALQTFKFKLWQDTLEEFGGIPIISLAEDVLFYRNCKDYFGHKFKTNEIKISKPSFLKIGDGDNMTVLEWTKNLKENEVDNWARSYIDSFQKINKKSSSEKYSYFKRMGESFLLSGEIKWD